MTILARTGSKLVTRPSAHNRIVEFFTGLSAFAPSAQSS
jgi:hypothetical protein